MLLTAVAVASVDVGAASARTAKIDRIAGLLGAAADDPATVAVVVELAGFGLAPAVLMACGFFLGAAGQVVKLSALRLHEP